LAKTFIPNQGSTFPPPPKSNLDKCDDKYMITFKTVPQEDPQVLTTCQAMGDPLTVKVTYKYSFLVIPNFILGIGQYVPITAQTVMRCE
jgi:hypothetical protein